MHKHILKNAGNGIKKALFFKISQGSMHPNPPRDTRAFDTSRANSCPTPPPPKFLSSYAYVYRDHFLETWKISPLRAEQFIHKYLLFLTCTSAMLVVKHKRTFYQFYCGHRRSGREQHFLVIPKRLVASASQELWPVSYVAFQSCRMQFKQ